MLKAIARRAGGLSRVFNLWTVLGIFFCTGTALVVVNAGLMFNLVRGRLRDVCAAAGNAYEQGGPESLRLMLLGAESGPGIRIHLVDSMGRDLATGHFASPRPSNARPSGLPIVPPNPALIVKNASYSCIAEAPARPAPLPFGPMLWVLPFVSVLCCSVGVYVTWRITRIERVVRHFGSGELATRMSMDSGDAIGQLSRTFNDMADRIQSLVASHQCLCSDMAHELCSPLGRLLLAIPSARRGTGGALDRIEMEANRINHLIEGLLDVARAEADRGSLQVEWVDLESLLAEIVDQCALEAEEKNCEIETDGLCHAGSVAADSEILRRAIENVLRNSLCHTPEGTRIRISTAGDLHSVTICIRDWGPGVPEPAIADIFRPFYRVETSWNRRTGGVGLGLAIAQRAVALHKGNIIAENCSPGLQVKIRLPRNPSLRA